MDRTARLDALEKKYFALSEIKPRFVGHPARSLAHHRLSCSGSKKLYVDRCLLETLPCLSIFAVCVS
jgi:hypothetical protein